MCYAVIMRVKDWIGTIAVYPHTDEGYDSALQHAHRLSEPGLKVIVKELNHT